MQLSEVADTSARVAATASRLAKRDLVADLLRRTPPSDLAVVVTYLAGELPQRRTGVGWASLDQLPPPADLPSLQVAAVNAELERVAGLSGPGSAAQRRTAVTTLFAAATAGEQRLLRGLLTGEVRQGALDATILDAVAAASQVPLAVLRRAVMVRGSTAPVAVAALTEGAEAVAAFTALVGQPVRPMLASAAPDVAAAVEKLGGAGAEVVVDEKLDGLRLQAHKTTAASGEVAVRLFTRSLDEVTERLADVAARVAELPARDLVLDGELVGVDEAGQQHLFQDTAGRAATRADSAQADAAVRLAPAFFDVLYHDGESLLDLPLRDRIARLDALVPAALRVERRVTADLAEVTAFYDLALAGGREGVVLKDPAAAYTAGRRGAAWVKVKPRHTLDLVVLAVEPGSGRRRGWLSNIHLGARDPDTGGYVMLGKTFKGMTDEMLRWQTARFTELAVDPTALTGQRVVELRPEQVVEIAFDGVQRSTRYPGGVALRFARVLRYRDDKAPAEVDDLATVRRFLTAR